MVTLNIEKIGGLAGFGPGSHLKSQGTKQFEDLSAEDQAAVEQLFASPSAREGNPNIRDGFAYRITKDAATPGPTITVPEDKVPMALRSVVKDTIV